MAAMRHLPQRFGLAVSAAPAVGAAVGFFALGERLSGPQWLAIALVVLAVGGSSATATRGQGPT